jgi:hypothetical protein
VEFVNWGLIALGMVCAIWGWFCLNPSEETGVLKAIGGMTFAYALAVSIGAIFSFHEGGYYGIWVGSLLGMFAMFGLSAGITLLVGGDTKPLCWTWLFMAVVMIFYAITTPLLGFTAGWTILMWLIVILLVSLFLMEQRWASAFWMKLSGLAFIAISLNCIFLIMVEELLPLP